MKEKGPFTLFLCLILLIYLIVAPMFLFPLEKGELGKGDKDKVSQWQGVITLWDIPRNTISGSNFGWIKARISEFEDENPGIYINLRELNYDNNKDIIERGALADQSQRPDILPLYVEGQPIPLDNIQPLGQLINGDVKNQIQEEFLQAVTYEGNMYGIPFSISGHVLFLNRELLENLGIDSPGDNEWSYEEFMDFIEEIETAEREEDIITFDAYIGPGEGSIFPILLSDGGEIYQQEQGRFAFYQPEMVSGFQKMLNIKNKATTHENFGVREKGEVHKDFLEEKKTVILASDSSLIYVLERLNKNNEGFPYEIMLYPTGNLDIPIWYGNNISTYGMMETEDKEKEQVIIRFFEFLLKEETQQSLESLGRFPIDTNIKNIYGEESLIEDWFKKTYDYKTYPLHPNGKEIEEKIVETVQTVLSESKTPTQACKDLQRQLE